jgi:hypothetical protein
MFNQFTKTILGLLTVALITYATSGLTFAQPSPPMSPWLGMLDKSRNPGQLDPYLRNVRPQQDMMKAYAAQASQIQNQQRALQALQDSGGGAGSNARSLAGGAAAPTSSQGNTLLQPPREIPSTQRNPAGYYQYLHYYPPNSLLRRPVPNYSQAGR